MSHNGSSEFDQEDVMKGMRMHMVAATGLMAATILAAMSATTGEATAREYPWCSYYNNGGQNCGFSTYGQCKSNLSGIDGLCHMNRSYAARQAQASSLGSVLARSRRFSR
jgi:Protein of unknown function (DUF3551)